MPVFTALYITNMPSPLLVLDGIFVVLGIYIVRQYLFDKGHTANVPPGPTGLPFIGNVLDMPTSYEHLTFARWSERWGRSFPGRITLRHTEILTMIIIQEISYL